MRRASFISLWLLFLIANTSVFAAPTVGSGSPSAAIQNGFIAAYERGSFSMLVNPVPVANVESLGSPGLVQEFYAAGSTGQKAALVMPNPANPGATYQMYPDLYTFYTSIGESIAGYPTMDTAACPANSYGVCNYQLFTKDYALFVYDALSLSCSVADPFYTEWSNQGGIASGPGPAIGAPTSVTSEAGTSGMQQLFASGAIYEYPPNSSAPSLYTVSGTIYTAFTGAGGIGTLGFPKSEAVLETSGTYQQVFENGRIELTPGSSPSVLFPIRQIQLLVSPSNFLSGPETLALGSTATIDAQVTDTEGNVVTGRTLTWVTSNGNAVTVQGSGYTVTILAVGAGSANITAVGEGVVGNVISVLVPAQCCTIGEGAPSQVVTQAFQQAAERNQLSVILPNPTPVTSLGNGYIQTLTAASGSGAIYVISESDQSAIAYVISGILYAAYVADGGFTGPLGYPASDASPGGTQSFANGAALAGMPVRLVPVPVAAKWIASGAETGPLGEPTGDASAFTSLSGFTGYSQVFAGGSIFGITSGSRAGQAWISSGPILAEYMSLSGPAGPLGVPTSDIFTSGTALEQNFETGSIILQAGATVATVQYNPRTPAVSVTPATVAPGGTVHVTISGFALGASLAVTTTGQSAFTAPAPLGEFAWNIVIPANAAAGVVAIQVKAGSSSDAASGSYTVVTIAQLRPQLTVVSGDQQTGAPGAVLPAPLIAMLTDINGNPLPGVPVSYSALPGTGIGGPAVTDANGIASAVLRLPAAQGATGASISAGGQVVTFSALAQAKQIPAFPSFTQVDAQSGFIAAMAAAVRYYQNSGALSAPNGLATPALLGAYLSANSGLTLSETGAPIANPWIAMRFAGVAGGLSVEATTLDQIRDLLSAGAPLVLELGLQVDGNPGGGATVDATGINADGSIAIMDPDPAFGQVSLAGYLNGFTAGGHTILATVAGVLQIIPTAITASGFVVASQVSAAASASSAAGACANSIDIAGEAAAGQPAAAKVGGAQFLECDGTQSVYEVGFGSNSGATVFDLGGAPDQPIAAGAVLAYQVTRQNGALVIAPQTISISGVFNSAGMGTGLSPGGLFSIFGQGFTAGPNMRTVTVGGVSAPILAEFPFQINAQMPAGLSAGSAVLEINGPVGAVSQSLTVLATAPGIFVIGTAADGSQLGAVVNQDGTVNSAVNPAQRGQYVSVYCTGLGATTAQGSLQVATAPVTVSIAGSSVKPSFAGLSPGTTGLYQVNVQIPAGTAPGSEVALSIAAGGQSSNTVVFAVQ